MEMPDIDLLSSQFDLDVEKYPIMYHYCTLDSFLSIVKYKTIRMSDINTMNDFSEYHWAYEKFIETINIEYEKYEREFFDYVDERFSSIQLHILPLICCFSTSGDVLSQWRAYTGDSSGVAIGFDSSALKKLSVAVRKVDYNKENQIRYFKEILKAFYLLWKTKKTKREEKELNQMINIESVDVCAFKNTAFSEESEVRLIRATIVDLTNGVMKLSDSVGSGADRVSRKVQNINYRARDGGLIAYIDLPFSGLGRKVIKEVVLGPKSKNNGNEVSAFLTSSGFSGFSIVKSSATLR
jgi:hypothetical protein